MKYVLCYGDSNTWGCAPETMARYEFDQRWPGVMQKELGADFHVYENALNGRTTVFDDPIEEGRCGKATLETALLMNAPLDLVILMLGTNDTKLRFNVSAWDIGWGMDLLIQYVRRTLSPAPRSLVTSPVALGTEWDNTILGTCFDTASSEKSRALPEIYAYIASRNGCDFFDAALHAKAGRDCVHLAPEEHRNLGAALALEVKRILCGS